MNDEIELTMLRQMNEIALDGFHDWKYFRSGFGLILPVGIVAQRRRPEVKGRDGVYATGSLTVQVGLQ